MKHLFLIGFMGSGKSTVAPLLSQKLEIPYLCTDTMIEKREKKSIATIFSSHQEEYFRQLEKEVLQEICTLKDPYIIDCGGGLPIFNPLQSLGIVIFLDIDFDMLFSRMSLEQIKNRPLFQSYENAYKLYQQRKKIYLEQADIFIDANLKTNEIVEIIQQRLKSKN